MVAFGNLGVSKRRYFTADHKVARPALPSAWQLVMEKMGKNLWFWFSAMIPEGKWLVHASTIEIQPTPKGEFPKTTVVQFRP